MTETRQRVAKVIEVAFATAASDGIAPGELIIFMDKLVAIPIVAEGIRSYLESEGIEEEEIDLGEFMQAATDLKVDTLELIELSDSYLREASSIIGEGVAINNLCVALCIVLCAGDGEVSGLESESINKVASSLPSIDVNLSQTMAQLIIEGPNAQDILE